MKKFIAPALLAMVAMCSQALAQSATETQRDRAGAADPTQRIETQRDEQSQTRSSAQSSQGNSLDRHIAVCLTLGNQEEIQLGQFAQDRAQHPQVKQFAQMMVEEHQQAVQQLQQAAPEVASLNLQLTAQGGQGATTGAGSRTQAATSAQPGEATQSTVSATAGNQRSSAAGQGGQQQQMVQFAKDVAQNCLQLTQQELGRKQGMEFDKAYIGQQIVAHTGMLAELQAAQQYASSEMRPIIQQGTQMTEHHLAQARQIMQQLDAAGEGGAGGRDQAQRPGAQPTR
ncbi:MAG TPA: DUF4142 domain-containing protein [Lacipirellula sp.]